jgi:hypothetical protein
VCFCCCVYVCLLNSTVFLHCSCCCSVAHYLKALQLEKKEGALKQHVEEEPPKINWVLIISIVVIIISYRMWATGTSKIIREDLFGFKAVEEMVESVADAAAAAASDGASGEL